LAVRGSFSLWPGQSSPVCTKSITSLVRSRRPEKRCCVVWMADPMRSFMCRSAPPGLSNRSGVFDNIVAFYMEPSPRCPRQSFVPETGIAFALVACLTNLHPRRPATGFPSLFAGGWFPIRPRAARYSRTPKEASRRKSQKTNPHRLTIYLLTVDKFCERLYPGSILYSYQYAVEVEVGDEGRREAKGST
jgi:hypothetical protein